MDTNLSELSRIDYKEVFPWTRLFRAFWIAVDIRKLMLAGLALAAISLGHWAFGFLPFAPPTKADGHTIAWPWEQSTAAHQNLQTVETLLDRPWNMIAEAMSNWSQLLGPIRSLVDPALVLFSTEASWSDLAFAWTNVFWVIAVWAIFGGAMTRMAAVEFARDSRLPLGSAIRFSGGKFLSYFSAPLLPILGIGFFWLMCLLGGLVGRIPVVGETVVGLFWFLALFAGFMLAVIVLVLATGWPLMSATISAEGSDAFDGFSRSYSYVIGRPWHYLWYAIVALVYGAVLVFFVSLIASLLVYFAAWAVAWGMGSETTATLHLAAPQMLGGGALMGKFAVESSLGSVFVGMWLNALALLVLGFSHSYFWTASTIIYFLLRHGDDATDFDDVYLPPQDDEPDELLPLVGVADSDQPVVERPPATGEMTSADPANPNEFESP